MKEMIIAIAKRRMLEFYSKQIDSIRKSYGYNRSASEMVAELREMLDEDWLRLFHEYRDYHD